MSNTTIIIAVVAIIVIAALFIYVVYKEKKIESVRKEFDEIFQHIKKNGEDIETNRRSIRDMLISASLSTQTDPRLIEDLNAILRKIEEDTDKAIALNSELQELVSNMYFDHPTLKKT